MKNQNEDPLADIQNYLNLCAADGIQPLQPADDYHYWAKGALIARIHELELHISDIYHDQK